MTRPRIAPVLIPHGYCDPGCPHCPNRADAAPVPGRPEVLRAMERARALGAAQPLELAFYGGDLWTLPVEARTELLAAAEDLVTEGLVCSIRVTMTPASVLRAPLAGLRARGVGAVELTVLSFDRSVLGRLAAGRGPEAGRTAIQQLQQAKIRCIAHLAPGLPGSSHITALTSADTLARLRPDAARVLPALALEGTHGGVDFEEGRWVPMSLDEAVFTCRHVVERLREAGTEIIRVGLSPAVDLQEAPEVLGGPYEPSLRQRVEAELLRSAAASALEAAFAVPMREFTFVVHPSEESYLRGHENRAVRRLQTQYRLDALPVRTSTTVARGRPVVLPGLPGPDQIAHVLESRKAS